MSSNKANRSPQGFTLIEVLVTLILLAVLAAAVFPLVTQQSNQGDPLRVASDLGSVRAAVEQFRLDVRPNWPGDLEDLAHAPVNGAGDDPDLNGDAIENAANWDGPYLDAGIVQKDDGLQTGEAFTTAFGGEIQSDLVCLSTGVTPLATWPATVPCASGHSVAIEIQEIDAAEALQLEALIDGNAALDITGKFRHAGGVATTGFYVIGPFF